MSVYARTEATSAAKSADLDVGTAALVVAGRTNREVAEALVITEATAEVHVKDI